MKKERIKHIKITSYYFNLNKLIKRMNQNLKNYLQKYIEIKRK